MPPRPPKSYVTGTVYRDPGGNGGQITLGISGQRYDLRRFSDLNPNALGLSISSARVSRRRTFNSETSLYLFSGLSTLSPSDYRRSIPQSLLMMRTQSPFINLHGDFLRITLPPSAAGTFWLDDLTVAGFNDKTTSVMLVDRWKRGANELTISAANTFTAPWIAALFAVLPIIQLALGGGVAISRIYDPVFSWIAFPPTDQALHENYTYMVMSQQFVFHAWGIGMNAWLMFYVRLGRDGNSKLQLNFVDVDYYVWPGTGQGGLMNSLAGAKEGIKSTLQTFSGLIFPNIPGTICDDVYLLPGTQSNSKASSNEWQPGNALSDVTIVLENPR